MQTFAPKSQRSFLIATKTLAEGCKINIYDKLSD